MFARSLYPHSEAHPLTATTRAPQHHKLPSQGRSAPLRGSLHQDSSCLTRRLHRPIQSSLDYRRFAARPSILCVEEDEDVAGSLATELGRLGYAVEFAADGERGMEKILASPPDLVLCDFWMPRMGGLDLIRTVRAVAPHFVVAFLFLPSRQDRDSELAARRLGADLLIKPIDFEMLGVVVENCIRPQRGPTAVQATTYLTRREKEVLTWVARGKTSAEIGIILGVSEYTVNFHCDHAIKRLDVINRTQAVAEALAGGLIRI
jgi:DNA-binding NarL/FixJ family response regulator